MESDNHSKKEIDLEFISQFDNGSIYAANAFRLLQLPITATDRDITKRKQIIEISQKTQVPVPDGPCKIYPIVNNGNQLDLNNLVDSLRDPVRRFYQEFFWFWPISDNEGQPAPDLHIQTASNTNKTVKIFSIDNYDPRTSAINLHNLAIFNHFCAVNNPESKSRTEISDFWQEAYKYWKDLAVLSDFWSLLSNRIREVNDPRLSDAHVTTLRNSALSILGFSNAQQAVRLIENDDIQGSQELLQLIPSNRRNLPRKNILKLATTTNRERLLAVESGVKRVSKDDPAHCDDEIESLITESVEELKVFSTLFSNTSTEFQTLRDGLIDTVFDALDTFFIKTEDYHRCIDLVKKIKQIPTNSKITEEIIARLEKYTDFGDNRQFWHCKNYFNNGVPQELFNRLEEAREIYDRQDYEVTIKTLDQIVVDYQSQPELLRKAIYPPLALTLNQQAVALQNKGAAFFVTPTSVIEAIIKNVRMNNNLCLDTLYRIKHESLRYYNGPLFCMSCLSVIFGTYYTGEIDDVPYLTCEKCEMRSREEIKKNKRKARSLLNECKDLLLRANLIQPENKLVKKNLGIIRKIFKEVYSVSIDIDQHKNKEKQPESPAASSRSPQTVNIPNRNTSTITTVTPKKPTPTALSTTAAKPKTQPVPQQKTKMNKSLDKVLIAVAVISTLIVFILFLLVILK